MKKIHEGCLAIYISDRYGETLPDGYEVDNEARDGSLVRVGSPIGRSPFMPDDFF